jgi:hypothetical protein
MVLLLVTPVMLLINFEVKLTEDIACIWMHYIIWMLFGVNNQALMLKIWSLTLPFFFFFFNLKNAACSD